MLTEDSAVRNLDELFPPENNTNTPSNNEKIGAIYATREHIDEIARYYEYYPQYTPAFNIIVETGSSVEGILMNMEAFMCPDGQLKPEVSELDDKILNFMNRGEIRRRISGTIGIRRTVVQVV